jgi:hypothetical protein
MPEIISLGARSEPRHPASPDYSHPFIQPPFDLSFVHRRITGVFGAHTAPFPVDDFSL